MDLDGDDDGGGFTLELFYSWASWEFFASTVPSNPLGLDHSMFRRAILDFILDL